MTEREDPGALRVVAGSPTDDETAAIAAVFAQLAAERAAATVLVEPIAAQSAWQRSRRALRQSRPQRATWAEPFGA